MKLARLLVCVSFATAFALGCAGSSPSLTSPSSADGLLDLTTSQVAGAWNLVSVQPAGQAEQAKPSGVTYTLTLADGRLSIRADCNSCGGTYTLSGRTVLAGPSLACTRAACATMAFESTYTKLLGGESTVSLSGGTLVLTSPRGVLRFAR